MLKILLLTIVILLFVNHIVLAQIDSITEPNTTQNYELSLNTYNNKPYSFKPKQFIYPSILVAYGAIKLNTKALKNFDESIKESIKYKHNKLKFDDYIQFAPATAVFGLNVLGIKGRHNIKDLTIIYGSTLLLTTAVVYSMKHLCGIERPDGTSFNSFPSGHTATAFAGAEFLRIEFREKNPWIGYAGYAVAIGTGILRVHNNRHWFSDVVAGAGLGILCTKTVYWLYPISNFTKKEIEKPKTVTTALLPYFGNGQTGISLSMTF